MKLKQIPAVLRAIVQEITGDPVKNAYDKVQIAAKNASRRVAEAEYHKMMANFYDSRVHAIDPFAGPVEAQDFADAMKSRHDHQLDWHVEDKRIQEAEAVLAARQAQYTQLKGAKA